MLIVYVTGRKNDSFQMTVRVLFLKKETPEEKLSIETQEINITFSLLLAFDKKAVFTFSIIS